MPCGLVAVPVGEGAGDVETGADGDRVLGEPRPPQPAMTASTTASAAATAMISRRLRRGARSDRPGGHRD